MECTIKSTEPAHPVFIYDVEKDEAVTASPAGARR